MNSYNINAVKFSMMQRDNHKADDLFMNHLPSGDYDGAERSQRIWKSQLLLAVLWNDRHCKI